MRGVVALIVANAGCGFQPSQGAQAAGDAPTGTHDAAIFDAPGHVVVDAGNVVMDAAPCADDDHDGVCNAVDDWPCGAKPTTPPNHLELTHNGGDTDFKLTSIALGGAGTLAVAAPGATVRIQMTYNAQDSACADCIDQLEIGWHPAGQRAGCIFDDDVPEQGGRQGAINTTAFTAPTAPGVYELRINIGQNYSCTYQGAHTWWGGSEPPDVVGKVCVH